MPDGAALYIANNSNDQKDTLLHVMAKEGNEAEVEYLLKMSVDPKEENIHHETPLFFRGENPRHLGILSSFSLALGIVCLQILSLEMIPLEFFSIYAGERFFYFLNMKSLKKR